MEKILHGVMLQCVYAVFSIDLYSSYETHKFICLILCRDLRRSVTVNFKQGAFSHIEHGVFNGFAVVCNDVYSFTFLKASSCSFGVEV